MKADSVRKERSDKMSYRDVIREDKSLIKKEKSELGQNSPILAT
jgi:hypothetical protein